MAIKPIGHYPKEWKPKVRKLHKYFVTEYEFEAEGYEILLTALFALNRLLEAQEILAREGLTYEINGQIRKHPANEIEKVARSQFMAAFKMLGISKVEEIKNNPGRPAKPN